MSRPTNRPNNRLDDELRNAFRREQPSDDFTMRVLERVALEPPPRLRWWQKLAMLIEPPKLKWIAIGVTASLLVAIGAMQYSRMQQAPVDNNVQVAKENPSPTTSDKDSVKPGSDQSTQQAVTNNTAPQSARMIRHVASSSTNHRLARVRRQEERELRAEGEVAKEKLMLALAIASSALSDAQKAVHDDGLQP